MLDNLKRLHYLDKYDYLGQILEQFNVADCYLPVKLSFQPKRLVLMFSQPILGLMLNDLNLIGTLPIIITNDLSLKLASNDLLILLDISPKSQKEVINFGAKFIQRQVVGLADNLINPKIISQYFWKIVIIRRLISFLNYNKLVPTIKITNQLQYLAESFSPIIPTSQNSIKQLALDVVGKTVVIYVNKKSSYITDIFKYSLNNIGHNLCWLGYDESYEFIDFPVWQTRGLSPYIALFVKVNPNDRASSFSLSNQKSIKLAILSKEISLKANSSIELNCLASLVADYLATYLAILQDIKPLIK